MKKLINLLLIAAVLFSLSACSLWGNDEEANMDTQNNEGPSALGPDSLPDMRGPIKPPST